MLLMGVPPMEKRVVVGSEYVVDQHKPKARFLVNMQRRLLRCGICVDSRPELPHLPIEQRARLR
jgi:hypothetical protein